MAEFNGATYSDEDCIAAFLAYQATVTDERPEGHQGEAAKSLGIDRTKFRRLLQVHSARNLSGDNPVSVPPGMVIKAHSVTTDAHGNVRSQSTRLGQEPGGDFETPDDYLVERATVQTTGDGAVTQKWVKLRKDAGELANLKSFFGNLSDDLIERFEATGAGSNSALDPLLLLDETAQRRANLHPLPDLHLGLAAWAGTTGEDWGLKKAVETYRGAMARLMAKAPPAAVGIILGGGDLLHSDSRDNMTRRSQNVLDVDGDYAQILEEACDLLIYQIGLAKQKYDRVEVRLLRGNHDEHATDALTLFLSAWYRKDNRVHIDIDRRGHWVYEHGKTMLGATHGHTTKIHEMPGLMAARHPEMWGRTKHRFAHGFHIHHRTKGGDEHGGVEFETHQSPAASDMFHSDGPWFSGRSFSVISYDEETGDEGRVIEKLR